MTDKIISTLKHGVIISLAQTGRLGLGNGDFRPFRKISQCERRTAAAGQVWKYGKSPSSNAHTKDR